MKKVFNFCLALFMAISLLVITSGCTYHSYKLVGIVFEDNPTEVVLLDDIEDQEIYNDVISKYGTNCHINLKEDNSFVWEYSPIDEIGAKITYTLSGTYKLDKKAETIVFSFYNKNGELKEGLTQQYSSSKIIYYDNEYYLVFK